MLIFYTPSGIENMIEMDGIPVNFQEDYQNHMKARKVACPALNKQFGIAEK
ncbi:hypothetical protein N482_25350 [Pseudoalteromonas luteoviolacea NCIMB 1942]|uniref:Uncharacterized protein n=2 Tax=Pseudoalteromonas luteoviolacea TaxID=43657 RepID=A0A167DJD6_9GAMM|nr:hypothetical protein N482_25350 [Pseudoalteromonas luteoviolacea NCIMB 1942]